MPDKTIPTPSIGNADECSHREQLAAYFIAAAPYEEQTAAQRIEYCRKLRELGELENREVLQAAGSSRVLVWGNPASHLQHLLTATQYLAAGLGYPLLLFPAKDTIINFHTLLHPRLLSLATVNLLRAACTAAPKEPIWVRLQEQASCLTLTLTAGAAVSDMQALAVAKECARLHGGSLAQSDNIVGFSCARMHTPPHDVHHYRCSTAEELLRDTLSPVWTGFYGWLFPSSPSSNTNDGSSDES